MATKYELEPRVSRTEIDWISKLMLDRVDPFNRDAIRFLYHFNWEVFSRAPGSRANHHCWPGGYLEHIRQVVGYVQYLYDFWVESGVLASLPEEEKFGVDEALTVAVLHDIEKPFSRWFDENGNIVADPSFATKPAEDALKVQILEQYGIDLSPAQELAMKYVEGIPDDEYSPNERGMTPLAALCHAADLLSARGSYF
ncbi:hypothetical protein KC930_00200 [Candidatus Saccharibacteria bacterium]|nr:hypothetical protein [Candidatus Saccharibacteria bacterium]